MKYFLALFICFISSILLTPLVKRLAYFVGAIDYPDQRKVHQTYMARLGGLAIFSSFLIGILILRPSNPFSPYILLGSIIIIVTGLIDDVKGLSAKAKLVGQLAAALTVVLIGGIEINFINVPFGGKLYLHSLSIPLTLIWIIGITNAINLIDGLDGLAAGVSSIALIAISVMSILMGNAYVTMISSIILCSTIGFLYHNFYPASIFMGDTGSMFLGYIISVLSLLGFKNVTFVSFIVPVIILGVPISDTLFAIIRRVINKAPLTSPDKSHLHHCLLRIGYSHIQTVLIIYGIAIMCAIVAIAFAHAFTWVSFIFCIALILLVELFAERIGLFGRGFHPLMRIARMLRFPMKDKG